MQREEQRPRVSQVHACCSKLSCEVICMDPPTVSVQGSARLHSGAVAYGIAVGIMETWLRFVGSGVG